MVQTCFFCRRIVFKTRGSCVRLECILVGGTRGHVRIIVSFVLGNFFITLFGRLSSGTQRWNSGISSRSSYRRSVSRRWRRRCSILRCRWHCGTRPRYRRDSTASLRRIHRCWYCRRNLHRLHWWTSSCIVRGAGLRRRRSTWQRWRWTSRRDRRRIFSTERSRAVSSRIYS